MQGCCLSFLTPKVKKDTLLGSKPCRAVEKHSPGHRANRKVNAYNARRNVVHAVVFAVAAVDAVDALNFCNGAGFVRSRPRRDTSKM